MTTYISFGNGRYDEISGTPCYRNLVTALICIQYASSTKVENQFQHYNLCQLGRDPQKVAEIYCLDYKQQLTKKNSDGPSLRAKSVLELWVTTFIPD